MRNKNSSSSKLNTLPRAWTADLSTPSYWMPRIKTKSNDSCLSSETTNSGMDLTLKSVVNTWSIRWNSTPMTSEQTNRNCITACFEKALSSETKMENYSNNPRWRNSNSFNSFR